MTKKKSLFKKYTIVLSEVIAPVTVVILMMFISIRLDEAIFPILFLGCILLSYFLKVLIGRKRPFVKHNKEIGDQYILDSDYSFPSLHASSLSIFIPILFLLYEHLFLVWMLWVIYISWTRVYLHLHYISDVMAGTIWGTLLGVIILIFV